MFLAHVSNRLGRTNTEGNVSFLELGSNPERRLDRDTLKIPGLNPRPKGRMHESAHERNA